LVEDASRSPEILKVLAIAELDLLFKNGMIIDGTGSPGFLGDVGVANGRIQKMGKLWDAKARRTIDIRGHMIAPGFVDMHTHSDLMLLAYPKAEAKIMQGVTTEVIGQDGLSFAPANREAMESVRAMTAGWNGEHESIKFDWSSVKEFLAKFDGYTSPNVAYCVPHGTVRLTVMGSENRRPTKDEMQEMRRLVRQGMKEGAVGLSTGMSYVPAMFADNDELIQLCEEAAQLGGYFSPHHRSYGKGVLESYAEMVEVCKKARCPLHLTHCVVNFPGNEGKAVELVKMLNSVDRREVDLTVDSYCYLPGSTTLAAMVLPPWSTTEGVAGMLANLADDEKCRRMKHDVEVEGIAGYHFVPMDWNTLEISSAPSKENQRWVGKRVSEIAKELGIEPFEAARKLLLEEKLNVNILVHIGHEDNVRTVMTLPYHTVATDGIMTGQKPHPRAWGTYARYLAKYTREEHMFTWQEIIRHMSTTAYRRLGQFDRGLIRPGMAADLVVFDPNKVRDTATFDNPRRYPEGIPYVAVNGVLVKDEGFHTDALPGRVLKLEAAQLA
jgi:N-acyl-D-amino-acid deacylase